MKKKSWLGYSVSIGFVIREFAIFPWMDSFFFWVALGPMPFFRQGGPQSSWKGASLHAASGWFQHLGLYLKMVLWSGVTMWCLSCRFVLLLHLNFSWLTAFLYGISMRLVHWAALGSSMVLATTYGEFLLLLSLPFPKTGVGVLAFVSLSLDSFILGWNFSLASQ